MNTKYRSEMELLDAVEANAALFEKNYHGCAQCVLAALMDTFPRIRHPEAFKSATGLAGGVGLSVEGSCGGLTGGVMGISLFYGRELQNIEDPEGDRFVSYRLSARLHERFVKEYGTSICGKIHERVMGQTYRLNHPDEWNGFIEAGGHAEKCPMVVGKAARWAAEIILTEEAARGLKTPCEDRA
ncbi:MAG: C-GCAxxG-C-C family protein [Deltaproteobacteria bacterium]|nr:C-GCAxxG-C-C family protein [Deltaproteobacteria bacterium]